ncbi:MAG TPA: GNAT family N-acetyltransferase [Thermoanaerobaculia bacterium]|nr:GNAT family N-acetyltransferase [Thermoanaerobaculia bacterium]
MSDPGNAPTLSTERLELRPFDGADAEGLHALFVDPDVRRHLLDGRAVDRDWVDAEIAASAERFASGRIGLWTVARRGERTPIGFVGFRDFLDPPQLQLIYGLAPSAWGQGLATEASREAIRYAFEEAGLTEIVAATDPPNHASEAVMRRLGMKFLEQASVGGQPTLFYRIYAKRNAAGDGG